MHWVGRALALIEHAEPAVLVSVIGTRGSAPRDSGTRMIVGVDTCHGTIGGGNLEYRAIAVAREQLTNRPVASRPSVTLRRFALGASLGQCCGGLVHLLFETLDREDVPWLQYLQDHHQRGRTVVMVTQAVEADIHKLLVSEIDSHGELARHQQSALLQARERLRHDITTAGQRQPGLWFEYLPADDFSILIFGAGHVGKALVRVLSTLPCRIRWVDSRQHEFPPDLPQNVSRVLTDEPAEEIALADDGSYVLILTHNHALDESICAAALRRDTLAWCGLIGSASKRRRFIQRFRTRGMDETCISRLCCPIGDPALGGKHPGEIAVSVAAQILDLRQQQLAGRTPFRQSGLQRHYRRTS